MTVTEKQIGEFLGAFPDEFVNLGPLGQRISARIYRLLAKGRPVAIQDIAASLDLLENDVEDIIKGWTGVFYDEAKSIVGYWGLTLRKMGHRFQINSHTLYTWCAWDSLFIPQIIGQTARVESADPVTREEIQITVSPEGISSVKPAGAVTSFMFPDPESIRSDVIRSFCHYVHFFTTPESAARWISESDKKEDMLILSLKEAYDLGRMKNVLQYKDIFDSLAPAGVTDQLAAAQQITSLKEEPIMSDSCCVIPGADGSGSDLCPTCGEKGKPVGAETINALVRPELKPEGGFPEGYYCPNPEDATLYFFPEGHSPLTKEDVSVRVGFKETEPPQLVCYCFEHTKQAIQEDFQQHGESLIEAGIREKVTAGECSCEVKNPKGRCCLGDVRAAYKQLATPEGSPA